jgi:hypothetical protein
VAKSIDLRAASPARRDSGRYWFLLVIAALLILGTALSLPKFVPAADPVGVVRPVVAIQLTTGGGVASGASETEINLYHQLQLSYGDTEWELVAAYLPGPSGIDVDRASVFLSPGSWPADSWTCFWIDFDPLESSTSLVPPALVEHPMLNSQDAVARDFQSRMQGAAVFSEPNRSAGVPRGQVWSHRFTLDDPAADHLRHVGVGCRRQGDLAPDLGGGRRLYQSPDLVVLDTAGANLVGLPDEVSSYPGEWEPGSFWAGDGTAAKGRWDPPVDFAPGGARLDSREASVGIRWNEAWFYDSRAAAQIEALAWAGALVLGAALGGLLAAIDPSALRSVRASKLVSESRVHLERNWRARGIARRGRLRRKGRRD